MKSVGCLISHITEPGYTDGDHFGALYHVTSPDVML